MHTTQYNTYNTTQHNTTQLSKVYQRLELFKASPLPDFEKNPTQLFSVMSVFDWTVFISLYSIAETVVLKMLFNVLQSILGGGRHCSACINSYYNLEEQLLVKFGTAVCRNAELDLFCFNKYKSL